MHRGAPLSPTPGGDWTVPAVTADGAAVAYADSGGDGVPVVLLHAFPVDGRMWEAQVTALGERFRIVAPDVGGFGASAPPADPYACTVDGYAGAVRALLAELGLDRVVVGGLSMGGYVAFAFLRRFPEAVAGLLLADTRAEADAPERREQRANQQAQVEAEDAGVLVEPLLEGLLGETSRRERPDVVERARRLMDQEPAAVVGALEAMKNRPDSTGLLSDIEVPTLVVVGDEDRQSPPEVARSMHERIRDSRLAVVPGAGHLSALEAPQAFNEALAAWLEEIPAQPQG